MNATILQIPTAARGAVRAFIKGDARWEPWINAKGVASRDAKNYQLLEFAVEHGVLEQVEHIIANAGPVSPARAEGERIAAAVREARDIAAGSTSIPPIASNFDVGSLLAGVEQFLSPLVKRELEQALLPVVQAANKPAVVTTIEKVVTVEAQAQAPVGSIPYATKTGATIEFAKLFSVRTSMGFAKKPISLWEAHGYAPALDPFHVVDVENMAALALAAEHATNVWLVGPSGSGKTSMVEQFAAFTGRPYVKITCTKQTDVADLVGSTAAKDGTTFWADGALLAAIRRPGTVIVIEEPMTMSAGAQMIIQNMTDDHRTYTVHATGEVVKVAPGVVFVIGDNTNGSGDETGQYAGTNAANASLVNRFKRMLKVDYLTKAQEAGALVNHTGIPLAAAEHVADFMHRARKLPEMEGVALSLRQMVGFVGAFKDGFDAKRSFEMAVLTRLPGTERAAIETMATLQWGAEFEALMQGQTAPATASDSAAAEAFEDFTF
jgi:cobaltochelatase CobS